MNSEHRTVRVLHLACISVLGCVAAVFLLISFLPFELVASRVNSAAPDGQAAAFTAELYRQITSRLRFMGLALLAAGLLAIMYRGAMRDYYARAVLTLPGFLRLGVQSLTSFLKREKRGHLYALGVLCLLGAALRVTFLFQPIRYDEAFSFLHYAVKPLYIGLSRYTAPNNHLFHTLLVHGSYVVFGNHPWVFRLPALLAGILLVPLTYLTVRLLYDKRAALIAAGVAAASSPLIEYSTNARGHMIVCLLSLAIAALGWYALKSGVEAAWLLWGLLVAIGFYTIPIMLYPFGMVSVWLVWSFMAGETDSDRGQFLKQFGTSVCAAVVVTAALYAPVFIVSGITPIVGNSYVTPKSFEYFFSNFPSTLIDTWQQWTRDVPLLLRWFFTAGLGIALVWHRRVAGYSLPVLAGVALWIAPLVVIQRVAPFVRVWLFLLPFVAGAAAAGVVFALRPLEQKMGRLGPALWALFAIGCSFWMGGTTLRTKSVYYSNETGTLRDAEQIVLFLKQHLRSGDVVVSAVPSGSPLVYHFDKQGMKVEITVPKWEERVGFYSLEQTVDENALTKTSRFMVVVGDVDQTIQQVASMARLQGPRFTAPRLLHSYPFATVFEIRTTGSD